MRNVQIAIVFAILAALANTARAETLEQKIASLLYRHEVSLVNMRAAENNVCSPAKDVTFHRTTEAQRKACIEEHEAMIVQSRQRYTKEIAWEASVSYKDPGSTDLKRELDVLIGQGYSMINGLQRKYSLPRVTTGQLN